MATQAEAKRLEDDLPQDLDAPHGEKSDAQSVDVVYLIAGKKVSQSIDRFQKDLHQKFAPLKKELGKLAELLRVDQNLQESIDYFQDVLKDAAVQFQETVEKIHNFPDTSSQREALLLFKQLEERLAEEYQALDDEIARVSKNVVKNPLNTIPKFVSKIFKKESQDEQQGVSLEHVFHKEATDKLLEATPQRRRDAEVEAELFPVKHSARSTALLMTEKSGRLIKDGADALRSPDRDNIRAAVGTAEEVFLKKIDQLHDNFTIVLERLKLKDEIHTEVANFKDSLAKLLKTYQEELRVISTPDLFANREQERVEYAQLMTELESRLQTAEVSQVLNRQDLSQIPIGLKEYGNTANNFASGVSSAAEIARTFADKNEFAKAKSELQEANNRLNVLLENVRAYDARKAELASAGTEESQPKSEKVEPVKTDADQEVEDEVKSNEKISSAESLKKAKTDKLRREISKSLIEFNTQLRDKSDKLLESGQIGKFADNVGMLSLHHWLQERTSVILQFADRITTDLLANFNDLSPEDQVKERKKHHADLFNLNNYLPDRPEMVEVAMKLEQTLLGDLEKAKQEFSSALSEYARISGYDSEMNEKILDAHQALVLRASGLIRRGSVDEARGAIDEISVKAGNMQTMVAIDAKRHSATVSETIIDPTKNTKENIEGFKNQIEEFRTHINDKVKALKGKLPNDFHDRLDELKKGYADELDELTVVAKSAVSSQELIHDARPLNRSKRSFDSECSLIEKEAALDALIHKLEGKDSATKKKKKTAEDGLDDTSGNTNADASEPKDPGAGGGDKGHGGKGTGGPKGPGDQPVEGPHDDDEEDDEDTKDSHRGSKPLREPVAKAEDEDEEDDQTAPREYSELEPERPRKVGKLELIGSRISETVKEAFNPDRWKRGGERAVVLPWNRSWREVRRMQRDWFDGWAKPKREKYQETIAERNDVIRQMAVKCQRLIPRLEGLSAERVSDLSNALAAIRGNEQALEHEIASLSAPITADDPDREDKMRANTELRLELIRDFVEQRQNGAASIQDILRELSSMSIPVKSLDVVSDLQDLNKDLMKKIREQNKVAGKLAQDERNRDMYSLKLARYSGAVEKRVNKMLEKQGHVEKAEKLTQEYESLNHFVKLYKEVNNEFEAKVERLIKKKAGLEQMEKEQGSDYDLEQTAREIAQIEEDLERFRESIADRSKFLETAEPRLEEIKRQLNPVSDRIDYWKQVKTEFASVAAVIAVHSDTEQIDMSAPAGGPSVQRGHRERVKGAGVVDLHADLRGRGPTNYAPSQKRSAVEQEKPLSTRLDAFLKEWNRPSRTVVNHVTREKLEAELGKDSPYLKPGEKTVDEFVAMLHEYYQEHGSTPRNFDTRVDDTRMRIEAKN